MTEEKWNTRKIAGLGALLFGAAMLIASAANGQLFNQRTIITINAVVFAVLAGGALFGLISAVRNHFAAPQATTQKWNTGRIALIGAGIGILLTILSGLQSGFGDSSDAATNAGMLTGSLAGGVIWGGMIGAGVSALRNFLVRRRIPAAPKGDDLA